MTEKKVFIITGTRKGLGLDLAQYFLSLDHIVVGCSRGKSKINLLPIVFLNFDVINFHLLQMILI